MGVALKGIERGIRAEIGIGYRTEKRIKIKMEKRIGIQRIGQQFFPF